MFILPFVANALLASETAHAAAVSKRQSVPNGFKCQDGYELSAYTSAGAATCTKISGTSITPGYSGQTVVFIGLISGLTGLIVSCTPFARYVYRTGYGFFSGNARDPSWHSAFPRDMSDSAVTTSDGDAVDTDLHTTWYEAFNKLQAHAHDPSATYTKITNATHTIGSYIHQGFSHEHAWYLVPHNETHSTWASHYQVSRVSDPSGIEKRSTGWTGSKVAYENLELPSGYHNFPISHANAQIIGEVIGGRYIDDVANHNPGRSQLCSYLASDNPNKPYGALISFTSQTGINTGYQIPDCSTDWLEGLTWHDELR